MQPSCQKYMPEESGIKISTERKKIINLEFYIQ